MIDDARWEVLDPEADEGVLARERSSGRRVVVRELTLGRIGSWKELELFEREGAVLRQLDHPAIPKVVEVGPGTGDDPSFVLVTECVDGISLETLLAAPSTTDPPLPSVPRIANEILAVLEYLQGFSPPVLHRDVCPATILVRPDGSLALTGFGSLAVRLPDTVGGSTIVGTSGYMAPELLMGKATAQSDLFGLGATLIHVLTRTHPGELPLDRMKLRWRDKVAGDEPAWFLSWVDGLVEPALGDRPRNAADARRLLRRGEEALVPSSPGVVRRPSQSELRIDHSPGRLVVTFPVRKEPHFLATAIYLAVASLVVLIVSFHLVLSETMIYGAMFVAAVGALPFLILGQRGRPNPTNAVLELDVARGYRLRSRDTEFRYRSGPIDDVIGPEKGFGAQEGTFSLVTRQSRFALDQELRPGDQRWLDEEIREFLTSHRATQGSE